MWVCGLDPGLGMTGVAILDEFKHLVHWGAYPSNKTGTTFDRCGMLAYEVTCYLDEKLHDDHPPLTIVVEHPIFGKNPLGFAKQVRVMQVLEEFCFEQYEQWNLERIVEVLPHAPKVVMGFRGSAKKEDVTALFEAEYGSICAEMRKPVKEAVADAWSIANCAWRSDLWLESIECHD